MVGFRLQALAKAKVADPTTRKSPVTSLWGWMALVGALLILSGSALWSIYSTMVISVSSGRSFLAQTKDGEQRAFSLVSIEEAQQLEPGLSATVSLEAYPASQYGCIRGVVDSVASTPVSRQELAELLGSIELVDDVAGRAPGFLVEIRLLKGDGPGGFEWTHQGGVGQLRLLRGAPAEVQIILDSFHPFEVLMDNEA